MENNNLGRFVEEISAVVQSFRDPGSRGLFVFACLPKQIYILKTLTIIRDVKRNKNSKLSIGVGSNDLSYRGNFSAK